MFLVTMDPALGNEARGRLPIAMDATPGAPAEGSVGLLFAILLPAGGHDATAPLRAPAP